MGQRRGTVEVKAHLGRQDVPFRAMDQLASRRGLPCPSRIHVVTTWSDAGTMCATLPLGRLATVPNKAVACYLWHQASLEHPPQAPEIRESGQAVLAHMVSTLRVSVSTAFP